MSYKHKGWPDTAGLSEIESEEIKIWLRFKAKTSVLQSFPNFQNVCMQGSGFFCSVFLNLNNSVVCAICVFEALLCVHTAALYVASPCVFLMSFIVTYKI